MRSDSERQRFSGSDTRSFVTKSYLRGASDAYPLHSKQNNKPRIETAVTEIRSKIETFTDFRVQWVSHCTILAGNQQHKGWQNKSHRQLIFAQRARKYRWFSNSSEQQ